MIYWLIPFLVAYNASDADNWKYGPEHVFKAEVRINATADDSSEMHCSVDMYLACRPMNSSLIQCRVESPTLDNWRIDADGTSKFHSPVPFEIGNVVFQVEFNEDGVSNLRLMNAKGRHRHDMLRSIIGTVHWGIVMSGKKHGRYDRVEKSMIGSCETTFDIGTETPSNEEVKVEKAIDGYSFDVPAFEGRTGDEPIVIEKNRNVDQCPEKTLHLFGSTNDEESDDSDDVTKKTQVTSSRSRIYLGRNSFSGYTRNIGNLKLTSSRAKSMPRFVNADETIHLSLETIRPAKEDIGQTGDLAKGGADFEDARTVKFFM